VANTITLGNAGRRGTGRYPGAATPAMSGGGTLNGGLGGAGGAGLGGGNAGKTGATGTYGGYGADGSS